MSASFLVVKSNFTKNKVQYVLIGMIIMVCATIMITGFATFGGMFSAFNTMCEKQEVSDILLQVNNDDYNVNELHKWWTSQPEVDKVSEIIPCTENRYITVGGETLSSYSDSVYFAIKFADEKVDHLMFSDNLKRVSPEDDKVWVCSSYAKQHNLSVGDFVKVPVNDSYVELEVGAITIDPYYSSGFIHPMRMWVNEATFGKIKGNMKESIITVKLKNSDDVDKVWKDFSKHLDQPFSGLILDKATIKYSYLIMTGIISSVMLLFSILILIITLYVVSTTLSISILADYKIIGILKSMGFIPKQIRNIYLFLYGIDSIISVALGSILSLFTCKLMMETFGSSIGINTYNFIVVIPYILFTFVILTGISLFVISKCATKAGEVSTIQAIRFGAQLKVALKTRKIPRWLYKIRKVSFIYAVKQTITNMRQTCFLLICLIITIFVIVFSVNVYTSVINMDENMATWGYDKSDAYVNLNNDYSNDEKILYDVLDDVRVKQYVGIDEYVPGSLMATDDFASSVIMGTVYDGNLDSLGLENLKGRNPDSSKEISIGINTANKYQINIGDDFNVTINGVSLSFEVCGIYQTVADMGSGYRITKKALERSSCNFTVDEYAVILSDKSNVNKYIDDYKYKYKKELTIGKSIDLVAGGMSSITNYVGLGVSLMSVMFLVILIIILVNFIILVVNKERKNYGVMKVCGMTPMQLRFVIVEQMWMEFLISAIIGIPLAILCTPQIMNLFMSSMGIIQYPITINIWLTGISVILVFFAITICAWLPSKKIMTISSRELIVE